MAQRSKSFRFRIPWLSVPSESFSRRTKDRQKSPPHSDTSVSIERPYKPSVVASSELSPPSPTKTEEAKTDEHQKQSPSHPTQPPSSSLPIESSVSTQPKSASPQPPLHPSSHADTPPHVQVSSSPPKTHLASDNGAREVSKPNAEEITAQSSSSEQEKEKMVVSEPKPQEAEPKVKSPLRTIAKSPETSLKPEGMPTYTADKDQEVSSVPSSTPVSKPEQTTTTHPSSPLASEDIKTEETTPQEETEKMEVLNPQEEKPKTKSPLKITHKSRETSPQPENPSTQPTTVVQRATTPKAPLETQSKSFRPEKKEKEVHETTKARRKGKDTTTTASASATAATKAKDSSSKEIPGNKKHHGARETVERKIMFATTNPIDTKVTSSTHEGTKNLSSSSISPEKTVSFSGEEAPPLQKGIKDDITKFVHKLTASVHPTQPMDEKQFSIITLAGDNRGATMHLGSESAKKEGPIHIHRAYKSDHEQINEVATDEEENTNEGEGEGEGEGEDEEVGMAYVNSNIQSINNSLMFDGSINERDPGVQLTLPQKPNELTRPDNKLKPGLDTQRTQFNMNRAERSAYQPTVGRSIRGCKFSCDKDIEDIEIL
ncbi:hypothetical protein Fmac_032621 [Flemingia macrophylla]|uniref:Proteoglycan 4-like n=1 Tax=Flemingia macrophylla TaxID=520843 RepID=A0ABD1L5F3_9FABA